MKYWTHSITLVENCSHVSEGCLNCWSEAMAHRFQKTVCNIHGINKPLTDAYTGKWTGNIIIREDRLPELLKGRKPRVVQIWNDLMHKNVPDEFIQQFHEHLSPKNTYLVLTKRAERMQDFYSKQQYADSDLHGNVFFGVTCESQKYAIERIPYLLKVPGKKWLSIEPLLSEMHIRAYLGQCECGYFETEHGDPSVPCQKFKSAISQVVVGCETGKNARPCEYKWIASVVEQCQEYRVPCFVKAINLNGKITSDITKFPESVKARELAWK